MVEVNPKHMRAFASAAELERWLVANHGTASELWLKIFKKGSGEPSVTYREAVEVALCWGWIDGLKKALDERAFLQRFSPRRPHSVWSQINRDLVTQLIAAGRMQAPGLAHVEAARADGRWAAAYGSRSSATLPAELLAAIEANPRALATYRQLDRANLFALSFRLTQLKTAAARERKLGELVAMLARGETLAPLSAARKARVESAAESSEPARQKAAPARQKAAASTREKLAAPTRKAAARAAPDPKRSGSGARAARPVKKRTPRS